MKFPMHPRILRDVREAPKFLVPKNIFLKILIFGCVFLISNMAQVCILYVKLIPDLFTWTAQRMDAVGTVTSEEVQDYLQTLLLDPEMTVLMLYSTIAATLVVFLYCRFVEGRKLFTLGFYKKGAWMQYGIGLLAGFVMFSLTTGIAWALGGIRFEGLQQFSAGSLLLVLIGYGFQGMSEEVLCRGFIMTSTMRHQPVWAAVLVNSVIFGLLHISNNGFSLLAMVNITLFGVFMSLYTLRTGNLWGACAIHSIWNFVQGNFYGLPVSGIDSGDSVFRFSLVSGKTLIQGGDFGLEAGICTSVVLLAACVVLYVIPLRYPEEAPSAVPEQTAA